MQNYPLPVLLTGANGGLGASIVEGLLKRGFRNLVCQYHTDESRIKQVLQHYQIDTHTRLMKADLTNELHVECLKHDIEKSHGGLWGVVNLAGASTNSMSWNLSRSEFDSVIWANLGTTFLTTRAFLPGMREKKSGRIVNVSSAVAQLGAPGASHYAAAKSAIEGFTRSIALEVANCSITANCIALGYFDQGLISQVKKEILDRVIEKTPLHRIGRSDEIVSLLIYLLSEESSFMTGQVLHFDGGLCL